MSDSVIVVPLHLDALYVQDPSPVAPPSADFSRLPFFDGQQDHNASIPWLGDSAANDSFDAARLLLPNGIHLHWRFPMPLTTGAQNANGTTIFPALPDRSGRHGAAS